MRTTRTLDALTKPIPARCGKCGGDGTIYSYPSPTGTFVCDACQPGFRRFIEYMDDRQREDMRNRDR